MPRESVEPVGDPTTLVHLAVVDDNTWYREGLGRDGSLGTHQHIMARAADAEELLRLFRTADWPRCDVIVLDLRIVRGLAPDPIHGGPRPATIAQGAPAIRLILDEAARQIHQSSIAEAPRILCYTQENSPRVHLNCLIAGAVGVVQKDEPLEHLVTAIDVVAAGGCVVSSDVATLIGLLADQRKVDISESQAQVLALAGHGYQRERIATTLCISVNTVDKHLAAIRAACGAALSYTDLADAFGLRDLAPPNPQNGAKRKRRERLLELKRQLRGFISN
jgi:DNA-binding NarL/FixJ family response regulator